MVSTLNITLDINECNTDNGGCDHNCINTQGSYQCQCREGYETNNNGINCTGMMLITLNVHTQQQQILMSVLLTMEGVNKYVKTLLEVSLVLVLMDII